MKPEPEDEDEYADTFIVDEDGNEIPKTSPSIFD
jgi:hypothetical protein